MEAVPLIFSAAIAALIAPGALAAFAANGWTRANWRDRALPFPAGAIAVAAAVLALGALAVADQVLGTHLLLSESGFGAPALVFAPLLLGVAFLGLLDDVLDARPRGWRGHARAVLGGGFSTGAMKALGTTALAVATLTAAGATGVRLVLGTLVIALATNLFNLLDLRPGRAAKAWVLLAAVLLLAEWDAAPLRAVGPFAGALLVLGAYDLRERCMLGDTGSNLLGALAGVWLVLSLENTGLAVAAAVMAAITIFGEFRSISKTVERLPPLRSLDSLGRRMDA